jgi:hypothetical protein
MKSEDKKDRLIKHDVGVQFYGNPNVGPRGENPSCKAQPRCQHVHVFIEITESMTTATTTAAAAPNIAMN